jgi:hypothetical protein
VAPPPQQQQQQQAKPIALLAQPSAALVAEPAFAPPPGIGDSMRARAILPRAILPTPSAILPTPTAILPTPTAILPTPAVVDTSSPPVGFLQWQMHQQQLLLEQLLAENANVAAQLSAMRPPPGIGGETIGDVFGADFFSLDVSDQTRPTRQ